MADLPVGLLSDIKDYLVITWQDDVIDKKITGFINRGMRRLQNIAGASLDFTEEDLPRSLLFDYCRYANSQALEVFETNFQADLLELNLVTQAPIIDSLVVMYEKQTDGYSITIAPHADEYNSYVYMVGSSLAVPNRLDTCSPNAYTIWNGKNIVATAGQDIMIVEVNDEYGAERAGNQKGKRDVCIKKPGCQR